MNNKSWNTKLGFITGPLLMGMGAYLLNDNNKMGYAFIILGVLRLGMTAYLYFKKPDVIE